jgi:hypothetical protein
MEAQAPGHVILIPRLTLRWSLSEAEMADPAEVERRAADLANTVAMQRGVRVTDSATAFSDEADWLVSYLRQRAAGAGDEWVHTTWRNAERRISGSAPLQRETVLIALSRLDATGDLAQVLVGLPQQTVGALATALGHGTALKEYSDRATGRGGEHASPPAAPPQISTDAKADHNSDTKLIASDHPVPSLQLVSAQANLADSESALLAIVTASAKSGQPISLKSISAAAEGPTSPTTRFGGLFYLLSLALELGIGEALWKVCLPEGLVLAHAAALLLGSEGAGDPAPALFGGVTADELLEWPTVSPEQQAEVCIELLAATVSALRSYEVLPSPEVRLDLVPSSAGRMLVAFGQSPFILFAWPAENARATAAGLAAFLNTWPAAFPVPRAPEALVHLDNTGRLQSVASTGRKNLFLPSGSGVPTLTLLAQICGAMAELFVLRVGRASAGVSELQSRYLTVSGGIELTHEAMTVVLPMDSIDLAVRRAALDRNPGWTPWLKRTVRIEFLDGGTQDPSDLLNPVA